LHVFIIIIIIDNNFIIIIIFFPKKKIKKKIAFGDPYSKEFIDLKNYEVNPQRESFGWTSNNSIYAEVRRATVTRTYTQAHTQTHTPTGGTASQGGTLKMLCNINHFEPHVEIILNGQL